MMKKAISLALAAIMLIVALASCGQTPPPPAHVHEYGAWSVSREATCTEEGSRARACTCGEVESEAIPASGHVASDWITDSEPTYEAAGERHMECTVCHTVLRSEPIGKLPLPVYTVTYSANGQSGRMEVSAIESFTLPVVEKRGYVLEGYYLGDVRVADGAGRRLPSYSLTSDITVVARYTRIPGDADANGEYLGNPGEAYYKSATSFAHKMSRNPWDMALYDGKLYVVGGYYGGSWNSAPPIYTYDTMTGEWSYANLTVKMYEALSPDNTAKAWYELPATSSSSNNVVGGIKGIPVTTDCEISSFKWVGGKLYALGADSINGYTWADGTVSTKLPTAVDATDTQKYVPNNLGNFYALEGGEGGDGWVEYRNHVLNGTHVYDVVEIDYNGTKALMFAVGTSGTPMPVKILTDPATKTYISPKFYRKDGTVYEGNSNNRVYNFFETDEGIFAFYAHQGGTDKKIFKYSVVNGEHRFDEVRDITLNATTSDTKNYLQSDVDKNGNATSARRLYTDFMKTASYGGFAYYTTGYLYKTKSFERNETTALAAPDGAIVTDLLARDGRLYALGFRKTGAATNAYTNYVWELDGEDTFTELRSFTSVGAYALSFEKDSEFFYVGLGGPTTHVTDSVTAVGDIVKLAIDPIG